MAGFDVTTDPKSGSVCLHLRGSFQFAEWSDLENWCEAHLGHGLTHWELDVSDLVNLPTILLGAFARLHLKLATKGAKLQLVSRSQSPISRLIRMSDLHQIIPLNEL